MEGAAVIEALELLNILLYLAFAGIVLAVGPRRPLTYLLAGLLAFFPIRDIISVLDTLLRHDVVLSYNAVVLFISAVYVFPFLQLAFLARAVDSPLTRPLRARAASWILAGGAFAALALPFVLHQRVIGGAVAHEAGGVRWSVVPGVEIVSPVVYLVPALFSIAAAFIAFRQAPVGSTSRRRARAYLVAFLAWDAMLIVGSVDYLLFRAGMIEAGWDAFLIALGLALSFAFPVLLARAFLRDQLFDFDLKVKWTLRRGTLVGFFVAAFFAAGSVAEQWLQQEYGVVVGGMAVGLLLFALRPLERAADRLADVAMPAVQPTPAYVAHKKLEVYKAAVESAQETGGVSTRERAALDRLRVKLGIAEADAAAVESEVLAPPGRPGDYDDSIVSS